MSGRSRRRLAGALALPLLFVGVLVGCEFIVSGDLPTYTCTGTDPSSCPSGMHCSVSTCVSDTEPGSEGGPPTDAPVQPETPPSLKEMGQSCTNDSNCQSGMCGTVNNLTSAVLTDQGSVCTLPCCTTAECPTGFVCYPAGTGGNYCVDAKRANRTPPADGDGGKAGGNCASNTDCRSGLCSSDGHCVDTCCSPSDCNGGTTCKLREDVLDPSNTPHDTWVCAVQNGSGAVGDGQQCPTGNNTECQNDNCLTVGGSNVCDPTCCNANDCAAVGLSVCSYGNNGSDFFKTCFGTRDAGAEGAPCPNGRADCNSFFCDSQSKKCGRPCCKSTDCNAGESCKPNGSNLLRCVKDTP